MLTQPARIRKLDARQTLGSVGGGAGLMEETDFSLVVEQGFKIDASSSDYASIESF